jgi:lysozyme
MRRWLWLVVIAGCGAPEEPTGETQQANTMVCPSMVVEGIDVSDGQGKPTWSKVQAGPPMRGFVFTKATQGDYFTASTFAANWSGIKAASMLRGAYHFFDATIDGVKQANHYLSVLTAAGGLQAGDLPPMLDIECPTSATQAQASANCEYTGNSGWQPPSVIAQRAFDWLNTVEAATGRTPIVYSYPSWFADVQFTDPKLANYPLYIATLNTTCTVGAPGCCASAPPPWTTATFWQYSFTGTVQGITGQVDLDRFVGSASQLMAFANPPAPDLGGGDLGGADGGTGDAATGGDLAGGDLAGVGAGDAGGPKGATGGCTCELVRRANGSDRIGTLLTLTGLALGLAARAIRRRRARLY